ncbi:glycosyltransferase [Colwellia sp. E2M01]|uniref:glycosyltransferase n=1 Tax=Colwellia sp. E2M01 TaxID=2841561 RepID=UPI001C08C0F8|nr:glycosyltransferase [Colwellia sp. E2M01]MBU2869092.1 glycosyltransferase [Colwellia sp. E2M01]
MIVKLVYFISKFHGFYATIDFLVEYSIRVLLPTQKSWERYLEMYSATYKDFGPSQKFYKDPGRFLKNMAIVLRSSTEQEKGILLIAYNYAFPTLTYLFNIDEITKRYHIVIEPSTARFCMPDILMFKGLNTDVFVQTGEIRDERFLNRFSDNLIPVPIAANWWIDSRIFAPNKAVEKDIDIIMVSSWLKLKRHYLLFEALQKLKKRGKIFTCVLVGYPIDITKQDIIDLACKYDVLEQVTLFESLNQVQIAKLYQRSKLNLLLSKREGFNRSVIEGLHADVPCLIREGFNFGDKYSYINEQTGGYFNDDTLDKAIEASITNIHKYTPHNWIKENKFTAQNAAIILEKAIYDTSCNKISSKVSALDGMEYWTPEDIDNFSSDYEFLIECIKDEILINE